MNEKNKIKKAVEEFVKEYKDKEIKVKDYEIEILKEAIRDQQREIGLLACENERMKLIITNKKEE